MSARLTVLYLYTWCQTSSPEPAAAESTGLGILFPEAAGRAGEGGASSVLTCSLGRVCFGKGPKKHRAAGAAPAPHSSVGSIPLPLGGAEAQAVPISIWGVMGCSPAVLAATVSCRAVTHGWTSLGAAPLLTAPLWGGDTPQCKEPL